MVRAIDPWVNVNMGGQIPPKWLVRVKEDYFKAGSDFFKDLGVDELLEVMDRSGVEKAILTTDLLSAIGPRVVLYSGPSKSLCPGSCGRPSNSDEGLLGPERARQGSPGSDGTGDSVSVRPAAESSQLLPPLRVLC